MYVKKEAYREGFRMCFLAPFVAYKKSLYFLQKS